MLVGDVVEKTGGSGSQIKHWPFTDCSKTNTIEMNILNNIVSSANAIKAHTQPHEVQVHFPTSELLLVQCTSLLCSPHSGKACRSLDCWPVSFCMLMQYSLLT